jgi:hypothetical protein
MKSRLWLDNVETPNRHKPEYTSHEVYSLHTRLLTAREVYSLWGRVEKMLFRPISEKQNSLSFNKLYCIPGGGID